MKNPAQSDVVLLQPPFFRFCGSHNDRMPLSLCYLSRFLEDAQISHVVYNADYTGAPRYWSWRWLFDHFATFRDAVDGKGSLYGEVLEQILAFDPKVVVIMAGDPLFATKDVGNVYIAMNFARALKERGIWTIGFGHFVTLEPARFQNAFDTLFVGEPSPMLIELVAGNGGARTTLQQLPGNVVPNLQHLFPAGQKTDVAMTSFGCVKRCDFCASKYMHCGEVTFVEPDTLAQDLRQRAEQALYLGDLNFTYSADHLRTVVSVVEQENIRKDFCVESRVDTLDEKKISLLKRIGVKTLKLGLEAASAAQLATFHKETTPAMNAAAIARLKSEGFKVIGYFMLGGVGVKTEHYAETLAWLKGQRLDHAVINIWSYDRGRDYKYETHFSPFAAARWGIPKEVFYRFLDFQKELNPTVGTIIE